MVKDWFGCFPLGGGGGVSLGYFSHHKSQFVRQRSWINAQKCGPENNHVSCPRSKTKLKCGGPCSNEVIFVPHGGRRDNWCVVAWWKADNPVWHKPFIQRGRCPVTRGVEGGYFQPHESDKAPPRWLSSAGQGLWPMSLKVQMYSCDLFLEHRLRAVPKL